jgi:hypothetical protein
LQLQTERWPGHSARTKIGIATQVTSRMTEAKAAPADHAFDRREWGALPLAGQRHHSTEWPCRTGEKQLDHRVRKLKMRAGGTFALLGKRGTKPQVVTE